MSTASSAAGTTPGRPGVLDLFAEHVRNRPATPAVVYGSTRLTYAELDEAAGALAAALRRRGVGPGRRVGILLPRSARVPVAIIGVMRAGAAYVPMEPGDPAERIATIVRDADLDLVVTDTATAPSLPAGPEGVDIDRCPEVPPEPAPDPGDEPGRPGHADPAYVIFTSGSTGRPKGVEILHGGLAGLVASTGPELSIDARDVWTCSHSFAFDYSVMEMWNALAFGGTLVVASPEEILDPRRTVELVVREGVTVLSQTPGSYYRLADALRAACEDGSAVLRLIIFGGDALSWTKVAASAPRRGSRPDCANMYGITEGTVAVTSLRVPADSLPDVVEGAIGEPLSFARCHVLDDAGEPVGPGVIGELHLGGDCVAHRYINNDVENRARFTPDHGAPDSGTRIYRTGDMVSRNPDGALRYHGRRDRQVKVRGYRIECGEVESAFLAEPRIRVCAAVLEGEQLVLYAGGDVAPAQRPGLLDRVRRLLPEYMVPARLVVFPELPMTGNGKIDLERLPELAREPGPGDGANSGAIPLAAPRTPLEAEVLTLWREVLGHDEVGTTSRFEDVGGQSHSAVALHQALCAAGHDVAVTDVFRYPTVRALSEHIAGTDDRGARADRRAERARRQREALSNVPTGRPDEEEPA